MKNKLMFLLARIFGKKFTHKDVGCHGTTTVTVYLWNEVVYVWSRKFDPSAKALYESLNEMHIENLTRRNS